MPSYQEVCDACPVNQAKLVEGGHEGECAALGSSSDWERFAGLCEAKLMLDQMGIDTESLSQLLANFPLLTGYRPE